jgi:hypothetical protein
MRSALRSQELPRGVTGTRVAFAEFVVHRVDPVTGGTTFWKRMLNQGSVHSRSVTTQERGVVISSGSWGSSALGQTFVAVDGNWLVWMTPERAVLEWWSPDAGVHRRSELGMPVGRVLDARDGLVLLQLRDSLGVETLEVRRLSLQPFEPRT